MPDRPIPAPAVDSGAPDLALVAADDALIDLLAAGAPPTRPTCSPPTSSRGATTPGRVRGERPAG